MLLTNYYNYKKLMFSGGRTYYGNHPESLYFTWVTGEKIGGSSPNLDPMYCYLGDLGAFLNQVRCSAFPTSISTASTISNTTSVFGVWLGRGNTPATLADYKLENPITSGLLITNQGQYKFSEENGVWTYLSSAILTNTTSEDIIIWEIGFVTALAAATKAWYPVLMERTVLTEPITVPAGGAKLLTLKLTQNNVLSVEA